MMRLVNLFGVLVLLTVSFTGCKSIANMISPPPEDISAVRTAVAKQAEAVDLAFALHKQSLQAMHDLGLEEAYGRIQQAVLDERHMAMANLEAGEILTNEKLDEIDRQAKVERKKAKEAWDNLLISGTEPQAWKDLRFVTSTLNTYILTRMGGDEQKTELMLQAHDLIRRDK